MAEILGLLLALLVLVTAWLLRRGWRALRRRLRAEGRAAIRHRIARARGAPLRRSRRIRRHQHERIGQLDAELARTRRLLRAAERERDALRRAGTTPPETRFHRVKRAFALHFHPDRLRSHPEAPVRNSIFREFWPVLRRIERS